MFLRFISMECKGGASKTEILRKKFVIVPEYSSCWAQIGKLYCLFVDIKALSKIPTSLKLTYYLCNFPLKPILLIQRSCLYSVFVLPTLENKYTMPNRNKHQSRNIVKSADWHEILKWNWTKSICSCRTWEQLLTLTIILFIFQ